MRIFPSGPEDRGMVARPGVRLGYGLRVLQVGATSFEFGADARRCEIPAYGGADHGALARLARISHWVSHVCVACPPFPI